MMDLNRNQELFRYAARTAASLCEVKDGDRIYRHLARENPAFKSVDPAAFRTEFLCARLALMAVLWQSRSAEYGIQDPDSGKIFLKVVMDSFQSPGVLDRAVKFSEYFYAPEVQEEPSLVMALAKRLLQNLKPFPTGKGSAVRGEPSPFLKTLAEVFESLRSSFENPFFEFVHSNLPNPNG